VSSPAKSTPSEAPAADFQIPKARAFKFILLFGFISLLADMTYEGALMGFLYDISLHALIIFSVAAQFLAVPMLLMVRTGTERALKT